MTTFQGVTPRVLPTKQEALFFDSVIPTSITWNMNSLSPSVRADFEYLADQGIITSAPPQVGPFDDQDPEFQYLKSLYDKVQDKVWEHLRRRPRKAASQSQWEIMSAICKKEMDIILPIGVRILARTLRNNHHFDTIAVLDTEPSIPSEAFRLESTASVIIKALPMPEDDTSWERIIDFRADQDARRQLIALRRWVRKLAKQDTPVNEVEEELEYLIGEYERYMNIHKMKHRKGILRTIISVSAGLITSTLKLDLKRAVDSIFEVQDQKTKLLEGEISAPGQEIAYIIRARSTLR